MGYMKAVFGTFSKKCDEMRGFWYEWKREMMIFSGIFLTFAHRIILLKYRLFCLKK